MFIFILHTLLRFHEDFVKSLLLGQFLQVKLPKLCRKQEYFVFAESADISKLLTF